MEMSRRLFLQQSAAAMIAGSIVSTRALATGASASKIKVGLQLYTLNAEMTKDLDGTLRQVAAIGYRHVELPGTYGRGASDLRKSLDAAGLICESGMFPLQALEANTPTLVDNLSQCIEFAQQIGWKYLVVPNVRIPGFGKPGFDLRKLREAFDSLTLDDIKRDGELLNRIGEQTRKAGIQLAYHNHNAEFKKFNGVPGYDELLRVTDPQLVVMEMDVGWVKAAGHDPTRYLTKYPGRFHLLHIKDLEPVAANTSMHMTSVEIGQGAVDWKSVFKAARATGVKAGYVEQEPPFVRPALESAKISFEYLQTLDT